MTRAAISLLARPELAANQLLPPSVLLKMLPTGYQSICPRTPAYTVSASEGSTAKALISTFVALCKEGIETVWVQFAPPSLLLYRPSPTLTYRTFGFEGAMISVAP